MDCETIYFDTGSTAGGKVIHIACDRSKLIPTAGLPVEQSVVV